MVTQSFKSEAVNDDDFIRKRNEQSNCQEQIQMRNTLVTEANLDSNGTTTEKEDYNFGVGVSFVLISQLCLCIRRTFAKQIYQAYPYLSVIQFLELQAIISLIVNVLTLNVNLKRILYDSVLPELRLGLFFKTVVTLIGMYLNFSAIKYFPLTYLSALKNMSPFVSMIFSAVCLAEAPSMMQMAVLVVVSALVMATILPDYSS